MSDNAENNLPYLSKKWVESHLDELPFYKPWFGKKIRKIELRSLGLSDEEEGDPDK